MTDITKTQVVRIKIKEYQTVKELAKFYDRSVSWMLSRIVADWITASNNLTQSHDTKN